MDFPISRERLQNYKIHEAALVETKQRISKEIQQICKDVEKTVLTTNERRYVYRIPAHVKNGELRPSNNPVSLVHPIRCLREVVLAIKNTFPDSNVTVDPLETYILIDWS